MLRAAGKRVSRDSVRQCVRPWEPLYLPWLCPSEQRYLQHRVRPPTSLFVSRKTIPTASYREYSTAAGPSYPKLPEHSPNFSYGSVAPTTAVSSMTDSKVVIYDTPTLEEKVRISRPGNTGVPREGNELLATFHACIQVGRVSRAQLMLTQMTGFREKDSPILVNAHNTFLQAMLDRATAEDDLKVFFVWYEEKMRKAFNIPPDDTTFALLLKASMKWENSAIMSRYVKQYVKTWKEMGGDIGTVLGMPILSDDDVVKIAKIAALKVNELHPKQQTLFTGADSEIAAKKKPSVLSIPEVVATQVRGAGLAAVKQSLRSLIDVDYIPTEPVAGSDDIAFQIERQKLLEEDAFDSAQERWRRDHEALASKGIISMPESINSLLWEWHQALVPLIKEELNRVREAEENPGIDSAIAAERCLYGPFLRLLEPEKVAAITIIELLRLQNALGMSDGMKSSRAVMQVGKMLEQEYLAQEIQKKKNRNVLGLLQNEDMTEIFQNRTLFARKVKLAREKLSEEPYPTVGLLPEWPSRVKAKVGAVLISMLIHCAKTPVTRTRPDTGEDVTLAHTAFYHSYEYVKGRKLGVLKFHPDIVKRLGSEPLRKGMLGRLLPMVVQPRPWISWNDGGYYYAVNRVVRTKASREQEIYVRTASERGDLEQVFAGLDVLGRTAWRINRPVFDVVLEVWNKGEAFADIPAMGKDLELPPEPAPNADPMVRFRWVKQVKELTTEKKNHHSQRCDINFKVEIARAFLFEKFYFPHNVDFRGRAYPIPPNLNHIGNDLSRGLLMFDEARELGETGLKWLKIHCANLAGFDKASFTDREKFVDENIEEIFDSATDPLGGKRWWLKSEDPWQTLAVCFALKDALSMEDPSKYKCQLPVAQDGTCNGLQHYAALGGDLMGAKQVNLEPSDKPQDVYQGVADLVTEAINEEAAEGNESALMLQGLISRKVVKQPVMTNVYGVTFVGARAQIQSQLKDIEAIPRDKRNHLATYLAKKVFFSIKTMFAGANNIQTWLAVCARMISRSIAPSQFEKLIANPTQEKMDFMTSVVWTTPLGLPVVQPYREEKPCLVRTNLQNVYISDPTVIDQVNSRKQMTAFPPNFIHSLDATHMLMSAMKCQEHNLMFASVHDSFWTHPSDVDTLNRILRDAFINLHSEDVMAKLLAEFETRYKGYKYLAKVNEDTAVAQAIKLVRKKRAEYLGMKGKKKLTVIDDLLWELERERLIASEDPLERKVGEEMITASVLLERAGGPMELEDKEKVTAGLGEVDMKVGKGKKEADVFNTENEDVDSADEFATDMEGEEEEEEEEDVEPVVKPKKTVNKTTLVWMPLKFPPLPEKGEFEVSRLKDSQYFFS
ncbi:DNA-directed RNA polymerase [Rhizina undulata]